MAIEPTADEERASWPTTSIVELEPPLEDERGEIQPLVDMPMKSCLLITSKKGTVRANHYHKTDRHFCYVLKGRIEYYRRPHGSSEPPTKIVAGKGQMIFTPSLEEHAMVFPEDTVFLVLSRNSRAQEAYEADVVRIDPINPESAGR